MRCRFQDGGEKPITVGSRVLYERIHEGRFRQTTAEVVELGEPDYDYSDAAQRAVEYPPKVTIRYPDGVTETLETTNVTRVSWADYPDGPEEHVYEVTDLELLA
jgi:hypothetical protein